MLTPASLADGDAGGGDAGGGDAGGGDAGGPATKLAFVSKNQYDGKLTGNGGAAAGDTLCTAEASAAGRQGVFVALLGTSALGGLTRLPAGPWRAADGTPVPARDQLLTTAVTLHLAADGTAVPVGEQVWTGTDASGATAPNTCSNWADVNVSMGKVGEIGLAGTRWLAETDQSCSSARHLYCFAQ